MERPPAINEALKKLPIDQQDTQAPPENEDEDVDFSKLRRRDNEHSVLPKVIRALVQNRREIKKQLQRERDEAKKGSLDIKQKAVKLVANSMYGCLGFSSSRFYAKPIAATITRYGR